MTREGRRRRLIHSIFSRASVTSSSLILDVDVSTRLLPSQALSQPEPYWLLSQRMHKT